MIVYRASRTTHVRDLSGEGARLFGGRWNSQGIAMLYTATSASLAMLEFLVHTMGTSGIKDFSLVAIELPKTRSIANVDLEGLPSDWNTPLGSPRTREIGDAFIVAGKSLGLKVNSALLLSEHNLLINPHHPLAQRLRIVEVTHLPIDPRFLR